MSYQPYLRLILALTLSIAACSLERATPDDLASEAPYDDAVAVSNAALTNATVTSGYPWALEIASCSAFAITDRVILTAEHCVDYLANGWHSSFQLYRTVSTSSTTDNTATLYNGEIYSERFPDADNAMRDLAVLVTRTSLGQGFSTRIYNGSYEQWDHLNGTGANATHDSYSILGFGLGATGNSCSGNVRNHKWLGTGRFVGGNAPRGNPQLTSVVYGIPYPAKTCNGDSGGPTFIRKNGWDLVIGATSGVDGNTMLATLIRPKLSWIKSAVAHAGVSMTCDQLGRDYFSSGGRAQVLIDSDRHVRCHH